MSDGGSDQASSSGTALNMGSDQASSSRRAIKQGSDQASSSGSTSNQGSDRAILSGSAINQNSAEASSSRSAPNKGSDQASATGKRNPLLSNSEPCYIHRVPKKLLVGAEDQFKPHVVSIGPYHHNDNDLEVTGLHKQLYLRSLTEKNTTPSTLLEVLKRKVRDVQKSSRDCYAKHIALDDESFVEMLVLDGCFILELLYRFHTNGEVDMKKKDVLFNRNWVLPGIRRDLVLLENQIPFEVLKILHETAKAPDRSVDLNVLIRTFFNPILPTTREAQIQSQLEGKHLLDLLRNHLINAPVTNASKHDVNVPVELELETLWTHTSGATDLHEAGVSFRKKVTHRSLLDITFQGGKFEIPPFYFGESWKVLLPNMMALEQCRGEYEDRITSYVCLMDNLINSHEDVKLLRKNGIIESREEDEMIASMINNLCKKTSYNEFYYDRLCKDVNKYRKSWRHRAKAELAQKYCKTPLRIASIIGASYLLFLATTQTIFGILSYIVAVHQGHN